MIAATTFDFVFGESIGTKVSEAIEPGGTASRPIAHARCDFESDDSGNAKFVLRGCRGTIAEIMVRPDTTTPPDANFDVTVKDETGRTIWTNTALSNSAETRALPAVAVANDLTFEFAGMGNAKKARVAIWIA